MKEFGPNIEGDGQYKIDFEKGVETPSVSENNEEKDFNDNIDEGYVNENAEDLYGRYNRIAIEKKAEKAEERKHPRPPLFPDFDHLK